MGCYPFSFLLHTKVTLHSIKMSDYEHAKPAAHGLDNGWDHIAQTRTSNAHQQGTLHDAHQATVSQVARPEFMKLGNPGPLGLLAFAITTFVVGLYECGAGYE